MTELTRLAEWIVPDDEIDHLDHMSTVFYAQRVEAGAARLLEALGASPRALAADGLMAAVVDRHTLFRREQRLGSPLVLDGGVVGVGDSRWELYAAMAHAGTGEQAAMFRLGVVLQDRATRTDVPWPAAWQEAARAVRIDPPARSSPRSLPPESLGVHLTLDDFARAGVASHLRREATPDTLDADGFWAPPRPRKWAGPRAGLPQGVMDEVWGRVPGCAWPALEMRNVTVAAVREGALLDSYTALLEVGHKTIRSGNWIFEARTGRLVSLMQQVNIFFNLTTRRPQEPPPELRALLDRLMNTELMREGG